MAQRKQLSALTGVRFFAALWVVAYHESTADGLLCNALAAAPAAVSNLIHCGYAAVSVFFVLSGFILAYSYRDRFSCRDFWSARFARIYPVYLLGLLLVAPPILGKIRLHLADPRQEAAGGIASLLLVQSWAPSTVLTWNIPGWSLSAEAFFYLLFPLLLIPLRGLGRGRLLAALLACCCLSLVITLSARFIFPGMRGIGPTAGLHGPWSLVLPYNPAIRLPEFVIGMILGRLFLSRPSAAAPKDDAPGGQACCLSGLVLIGLLCCCFAPHLPLLVIHNTALIPATALLIYGLARGGGIVERFLRLPILVLLGEASYATYILHVPFVSWLLRIDKKTAHLHVGHPTMFFIAYVALLIALSVATYRYVETPLRKYLRRRLTTPVRKEQPVLGDAMQPAAGCR